MAMARDDGGSPGAIALVIGLCGFGATMGMRALDPIVPQLAESYGVTLRAASLAASGFAFAYGIGQLVTGPLADRYGRFRVLSAALLAVACFSTVAALGGPFPLLLSTRGAAGLCASAVVPSGLTLMAHLYAPQDRGPALARFMTAVISGQLCGSLLMGQAFPWLGARPVFMILAAAPLAGLALLARFRNVPALTMRSEGGLVRHLSAIARTTAMPWLVVLGLLEGSLVFGTLPYVSVGMRQLLGAGPQASGWAVAVFGAGGIVFSLSVRPILKLLRQRQFLGGAWGSALALWLLFRVPAGFGLVWVMGWMLIAGVSFYAMHNAVQSAASCCYPAARSTAMSLFVFAFFIGQGTGPLAFDAAVRSAGSIPSAFALFAAGLVLTGILGHGAVFHKA